MAEATSDLLHQLALVGIHRVEPINHVMFGRMGRGVAQGAQGIHRPQGFFAAPLQTAVHALRLVHDQDGPRGPDQVDRLFAAGLLAVLVEVIDVLLVDGADRHHHDLDRWTGGEIPHLPELRRVIEEIFKRCSRIE